MKTPEQQTIASYDRYAKEFAKYYDRQQGWKKETLLFKRLLPGGNVLDIGCGSGRDTKRLFQSGFTVTAMDPSKKMLEIARKKSPRAAFVKKEALQIDFQKDSFDGFWAANVLLHIPKKRIRLVLKKIWRVIRPNGIGMISVKKGDSEKLEEYSSTIGKKAPRLFSYYPAVTFQKLLKKSGFSVIKKYAPGHFPNGAVFFVRVKK